MVRKNHFWSNVESIAYRYWFDNDRPRYNRVPYTRDIIPRKIWTDPLLAYDLSHRAHIYTYIPRNNHVIFKMLLCPHVLLCINKNNNGNTRKKESRHHAPYLRSHYGYSVCPRNVIHFSKKSHLPYFYTDPKKETLTDLLHRAYLDTSDIFRTLSYMARKKTLRIFTEYCDAVMYCVNNDIKYRNVVKHGLRPNTSKSWYVIKSNGKALRT